MQLQCTQYFVFTKQIEIRLFRNIFLLLFSFYLNVKKKFWCSPVGIYLLKVNNRNTSYWNMYLVLILPSNENNNFRMLKITSQNNAFPGQHLFVGSEEWKEHNNASKQWSKQERHLGQWRLGLRKAFIVFVMLHIYYSVFIRSNGLMPKSLTQM